MTHSAHLRLVGGAIVAAVALLAAVVAGRPEPALVAAPFLAVVALGLAWGGRPSARLHVEVTPDRVLVGDEIRVEAVVETSRAGRRVLATVEVPPSFEIVDARPSTETVATDRRAIVAWRLRATDWGGRHGVHVTARVTDRYGLYSTVVTGTSGVLRALPREEHLRRILAPMTLRAVLGGHISRQRGDGIEFADMRPFVPGDLARTVNWRVSARRGELWVDERHPDRSGEVVLFVDSFATTGVDQDDTLRRTVELAGALAARHLAANDRLGLIDLGGVFRWVRPAGGSRQLYRIVDALTDSQIVDSVADKPLEIIPARALPRRSMVVALSPLLDRRGIATMVRMRAQGMDVAVVEVSAEDVVTAREGRRGALAHRLWSIEREMVRADLRRRGIGVAVWRSGDPVDPVLDELKVHREAVLRWAR